MFLLKFAGALLGLSLLGITCHAAVRQGLCPELIPQLNFNLDAYLGTWYEIQRYEQEFQLSLDCATAEYTLEDPNVPRVTVVNSGISFNGTEDIFVEVRGVAVPSYPEDARNPAQLSVAFFGMEPDRSNYWILGTDYRSFSLVWSCEQITAESYREFAWILSREQKIPPYVLAQVYMLLAGNGIAMEDLRVTDQSVRCYGDASPF